MKTSAFTSIDGIDMTVTEWDCGCWHEEGYDILGKLCHLRFQACELCFGELARYLDQLDVDKRAQLTLDLPSAKGDRGEP